jgi:hypothetical protein
MAIYGLIVKIILFGKKTKIRFKKSLIGQIHLLEVELCLTTYVANCCLYMNYFANSLGNFAVML